jgi:hypothetical protein
MAKKTTNPNAVSLSKREFAKRHSVSERTIDMWRKDGLPALVPGRRKVLIPVDLGDAWIRNRFMVTSDKKTVSKLSSIIKGDSNV